jgi:hypothetical protein
MNDTSLLVKITDSVGNLEDDMAGELFAEVGELDAEETRDRGRSAEVRS